MDLGLLLLCWKSFLRRVALRAARNSPVHSNSAINYAIAVRLFRTVLRDRLKKTCPGTIATYRPIALFFWKLEGKT